MTTKIPIYQIRVWDSTQRKWNYVISCEDKEHTLQFLIKLSNEGKKLQVIEDHYYKGSLPNSNIVA